MRASPVPAAAWQSRLIIPTAAATFCLMLLASTDACLAQFALTSQPTKADRDRMYQEVAGEVAALERQGNILKKVILLAQPTVVHIEAKKTQEGLGRKNSRMS